MEMDPAKYKYFEGYFNQLDNDQSGSLSLVSVQVILKKSMLPEQVVS